MILTEVTIDCRPERCAEFKSSHWVVTKSVPEQMKYFNTSRNEHITNYTMLITLHKCSSTGKLYKNTYARTFQQEVSLKDFSGGNIKEVNTKLKELFNKWKSNSIKWSGYEDYNAYRLEQMENLSGFHFKGITLNSLMRVKTNVQ